MRSRSKPSLFCPSAARRGPARGALAAGLVCLLVGATAGCSGGMNRRDEYYLIRSLTFQPTPGDGSMIVVGREHEVLRAIAGAGDAPSRGLDMGR